MLKATWLSLLLALPALPAAAESLAPREAAGAAATVRIGPAALTPARTRLAEGRTFRIANESTALARLEFHLKRGHGVPCARPGEPPVSARKFVLSQGEALHCVPPLGRVEYRVQRVVALEGRGARNHVTEGEIETR